MVVTISIRGVDGDLGDPRGVIRHVPASRLSDTSPSESYSISRQGVDPLPPAMCPAEVLTLRHESSETDLGSFGR